MSIRCRSTSPPSARLALIAGILLIAASCAGGSPEPDQARTTTVTDAIAADAESSTPAAPGQTDTTEAGTPGTTTPERTDRHEATEVEPPAPPTPDQTNSTEPDTPQPPTPDQTDPAEAATPASLAPAETGPNDDAPEPPIPEPTDARVRGTVTYRERIALTPGATLTVHLRDTSLMDVASELIAEQVITDPGQVPIRFEIPYASATIDPRNTYSISARIEETDGRLAFINDTAYDVITRGNPTNVDLVLVMVQPPPDMVDGEWSAEDRQPVEAPVTVTGTDVIWEAPYAYVRVIFVVSDEDGCYRRGREEAAVDGTHIDVTVTAWVPPPAPWAMDCSDETLELDAIADVDDTLVSGQTYTITVNGEDAATFTVP